MKILVVNIPAGAEHSDAGRFIRDVLVPLWRRNFELVRAPDVALTFRFAEGGTVHPAFAECCYLPELNAEAMIGAAANAEAAGFGAVVMTCFGDPALWRLRDELNIPVVSIGESAILAACAMGYRLGIVSPSPFLVEPIREQAIRYGLGERLAGVVATAETAREQEVSLTHALHAVAHFTAAAKQLIEAGADVLIPGCGLMSPSLRLAPGMAAHSAGLTEVDGIPVVDILSAAMLDAQNLVRLKAAGSAWRGHDGYRSAPEDPEAARGHRGSAAAVLSYWDC